MIEDFEVYSEETLSSTTYYARCQCGAGGGCGGGGT